MRALAVVLFLLGLLCLAQPSRADMMLTGVGGGPVSSAAVTGTYSLAGSGEYSGSLNTATFSINIGTATSTRYIVVGLGAGLIGAGVTATVAGTLLNVDSSNTSSNNAYIFSGLVTSGSGAQNVVIGCSSCGFIVRDVAVWVITSLVTNSVQAAANDSGNNSSMPISVQAGGLLFVVQFGASTFTYNGSTQAPFENTAITTSSSADWTIVSTNAAFAIVSSGSYTSAHPAAAATYQ